jgi:hypothetical protein
MVGVSFDVGTQTEDAERWGVVREVAARAEEVAESWRAES